MKKILITLALAATALTSLAQTPTNTLDAVPKALTTLGVSPNIANGVGFVVGNLLDASPYITNGDALTEVGVLKAGNQYGAFLDVQLPVNTNSWQMTYGFTMAYLNHTLYSGSLNVTLGTTVNIPVISPIIGPFYAYVESGPGYNFQSGGIIVQSFAGLKYQHAFSSHFAILASVGEGKISDLPGTVQEASLGATFHFGKLF